MRSRANVEFRPLTFGSSTFEGYELPALQGAWPTTPAAAGDAPLDSAGHGT
jgi:hypothetical protein